MNLRDLLVPMIVPFLLAATVVSAQSSPAKPDYQLHGAALAPAPADPAITAALDQISDARIRQTIEKLVGFGTRNTLSSMETDLPPGQGVTAAADWIFAQFEEISKECNGCLEVKRDTFTNPVADRIPKPTTITNVYAILRGKDPAQAKRMYLVTGHYDSRNSNTADDHGTAPGANDDASGVAVSLESARVLSKLSLPASLVFVAVAGEEQGLNGSTHLAQLAKSEGWKLEGVLNNDIVGGNTTPGDTLQRKDVVRVFSEGIASAATPEQIRRVRALGLFDDAPSRQLARAMADAGRTYFLGTAPGSGTTPSFAAFLVARPDRYLRGGDHTSFNKEGFSAVRVTEWREDFNHQHQDIRVEAGVQYGDLLKYVDYGYVAKVARLNAATLATLAASPGIVTEVKLVLDRLDNNTTIHWKAPEGTSENGASAAGTKAGLHYELLWRETTAADWQYVLEILAPPGAEPVTVTVPISKDNVIFGVRAVDASGHRGLVVTP
ncbi:M20/M25/M40 family metallo-hydrolase [Acidicapsa ligni]|uniref:M20/M25/M40 family metallo-hydrolase n=1 Tax=Acidicapsa ligni TaxID=542300 RepID=UPI0021DFF6FD|nr:M20/M25/M40 family metallo-hydrolase [Acidicapsa ligni]